MSKYSINKTPANILQQLSVDFKALRKARRFTQAEMAERSGVAYITLRRFEKTGQISLESLLKLAHALDRLDDFEAIFKLQKQIDLDKLFSEKAKRK